MIVARLRPLAEADLVERTRYYSAEGGTDLGVRFFDAAVGSLRAIERMPDAGSPASGSCATSQGFESDESKAFQSAGSTSFGRITSTLSVSCPTPRTCRSSGPISTPTDRPSRWACSPGAIGRCAHAERRFCGAASA